MRPWRSIQLTSTRRATWLSRWSPVRANTRPAFDSATIRAVSVLSAFGSLTTLIGGFLLDFLGHRLGQPLAQAPPEAVRADHRQIDRVNALGIERLVADVVRRTTAQQHQKAQGDRCGRKREEGRGRGGESAEATAVDKEQEHGRQGDFAAGGTSIISPSPSPSPRRLSAVHSGYLCFGSNRSVSHLKYLGGSSGKVRIFSNCSLASLAFCVVGYSSITHL